jgi:hypothetical protein
VSVNREHQFPTFALLILDVTVQKTGDYDMPHVGKLNLVPTNKALKSTQPHLVVHLVCSTAFFAHIRDFKKTIFSGFGSSQVLYHYTFDPIVNRKYQHHMVQKKNPQNTNTPRKEFWQSG